MAEKELDYIDKNDPTLKAVESEKNTAINNSNKLYDDAVSANDKAVQDMIDQNNAAAKEAERFQQEQTDFTIEKIEQQKEQAKKDYIKEQSASYVDWQKQSGEYGANAEAMADRGMSNTGYSESAQVSMYNTYQNRVATARASFDKIDLEYNNGIKEAKLLNSSAIAKIKAEAMAAQLQLALEGLQYKNTMLTQKANAALAIDETYNQKYMDVYNQLYKDESVSEEVKPDFRGDNKSYEIDKNTGALTNESLVAYNKNKANQVSTQYYKGQANPDAKNGTFANGYQPDNINGEKLTKTGLTTTVETKTLNGEKRTVKQNIWKTPDGRIWCWNGRLNKYEEAVATQYYIGARNPDAQNGTFANGYQPDNINGEKLYKTGDKLYLDTQTLDGEYKNVNQNIWSTKDGRRYYWDGRLNKYVSLGKGDHLFQKNAKEARSDARDKSDTLPNINIPGFKPTRSKSVLDDLSKLFI